MYLARFGGELNSTLLTKRALWCRRHQFESDLQQRRFDAAIGRLNEYFGDVKLAEISQALTDGFVKARGNTGGARRDLETLRAAINHHAKQNLHRALISVGASREGAAARQMA